MQGSEGARPACQRRSSASQSTGRPKLKRPSLQGEWGAPSSWTGRTRGALAGNGGAKPAFGCACAEAAAPESASMVATPLAMLVRALFIVISIRDDATAASPAGIVPGLD
ncbi:hypothetical protein AB4Z40_24970 [Bosea sp. 2YAB26]|uniref:hypothetical protein n=1 Tax=Bosea sp. 2YAB26 TaxID=3237478 RepID=UPI003F8E0B11